MAVETHSSSPIPEAELTRLAAEACDTALKGVEHYDHEKVPGWSSKIIQQVLQSLVSAIPSDDSENTEDGVKQEHSKPTYRFNVTCTIIQQGFSNKEGSHSVETAGRRGMHCASGAYWDTKHDGMWTYKHPSGDEKGMDLVLNVVWFGSLK